MFEEVKPFLGKINAFILNPLISLVFAVAALVFFYGIFQFIRSQTSDAKREEGKGKIFYGLIGMFIMFSVFAIMKLIANTIGANVSGIDFLN